MKKFLFALSILFCSMLIFSVTLASDSTLACDKCGNTDLGWFPLSGNGQDFHVRFCEACYIMVGPSEPCEPLPGSATCSAPERCKVCGFLLTTSGKPDPNVHNWETPQYSWYYLGEDSETGIPFYDCTAFRQCMNYCGSAQYESVNASHTITSTSTCTTYGTVTFTASFESSWAETQVNKQFFGSLADHISSTNKVISPTCTDCGYTLHICSACNNEYSDEITKALGHWYDLWTPNLDGRHTAECKRSGCRHNGTAECTLFEITIRNNASETIFSVCPVCGGHEETPFPAIIEAVITAIDNYALPRGELIVRGLDAPFEGVLYALTTAYEYSGIVQPFKGSVSVTIPLDEEKYPEFNVVRVDVTPAAGTTPRTEVLTYVPFAFEDGKLTFETDAAGLFLLIPKQ